MAFFFETKAGLISKEKSDDRQLSRLIASKVKRNTQWESSFVKSVVTGMQNNLFRSDA